MNLKMHLVELMEENFRGKEKPFNYKLFEKNEISSSGEFDIPNFKLDGNLKPLQQTIGVLLLSILKENKYNIIGIIEDKKEFVLNRRFSLEDHKTVYTDLCDISLYLGDGWIITVFEINYNHILSLFESDPYKLILFLYFSVQNAFLDTRIMYYDLNPDPRNPHYMVFSFISSFTLDNVYYASYIFENYGVCPVDRFNKSFKTKAKPLFSSLERLNKQRFTSNDKTVSVSENKSRSRRKGVHKKQESNISN